MADVPDNPVARRIEHGVEGDRELDDTQPGSNVATGPRADLNQTRPQFLRDGAQLIARHRLQIGRRMDPFED
jgi:hypothetical protein